MEPIFRIAPPYLAPGLSANALIEAYADWLIHLAHSPRKLTALVEEALHEAVGFGLYAVQATVDVRAPPYIEPPPHD